jgi:uncharacterized protein DUF3592
MKINYSSTKNMNPGCVIIFAVPFAATGILMFFLIVSTLVKKIAVEYWEKTPAVILKVNLKTNRSSDSTTYKVEAEYQYEYDGETYTGTCVGLDNMSDNIFSFHKEKYRELSRYMDTEDPFPCYVNPSKPSESILYKEIRIALLAIYSVFLLVFGGIGFGLIISALFSRKKLKKVKNLKKENPGKSWLHKKEWAEGRIVHSSKSVMFGSSIFALVWNLISTPIIFLIIHEAFIKEGNKAALFALIFPVVGICLIIWAMKSILQWKKYGDSIFEMDNVPGVIGGALGGYIFTKVNIRPDDGFHLTLSCIRQRVTGSGKNRSASESILWQDVKIIAREALESDFTKSAIPVLFSIPFDAQETDESNQNDKIVWRLEVKASVPGVDYSAKFEIPVFRTEESSPDFVPDESAISEFMAKSDSGKMFRNAGIIYQELPSGGRIITFPMARHPGTALGLTVFLAIWSGVVIFMFKLGAPIFFPIIFGIIDLLIFWGVLDQWFGTSRIEASQGMLSISGGLFGLGKTRYLNYTEIREMKPEKSMQSGNKVYYRIKIYTVEGKKINAGKNIDSLPLAKRIIEEIEHTILK